MTSMRRRAPASLLLLLLAAPLAAQANRPVETLEPRVDSIFAPYAGGESPGCAVAVVDDGREVFAKGYGMASLEHGVPITPRTAFYAASVSKQFTAFAVALLAHEGKLSLDDDVRKWIPEVPDFGPTITVRHLVHHTSGLRDYFGLLGLTGWPSDGPLTEEAFLDLVGRQRALNFQPGAEFLYSNTGYVLLSILVERASGQSLREFADARIFRPLGMTSTGFRDDHTALVENRALAYQARREGGYRLSMPGFDVVGDGGLYTTVEDLARWARTFEGHEVGGPDVAGAVLTRGRLAGGEEIAYAFGLTHGEYRGLPSVQHGGSYGGYRTHFLRFPGERAAVVTLCNVATANAATLSQRVAEVILADALGPVQERPVPPGSTGEGVAVSPERLAGYAGAYWDRRLASLRRFAVRDGRLSVHAGGEWLPLVPLAEDRFRVPQAPITFRFAVGPDGSPRLEETNGSGDVTVYQRMPDPIPGRGVAEYAGDYRSEELDVTWRLEEADGRLVVRRRGAAEQVLEPVFPDAFASPGGVVRFERDSTGRIASFALSAGRVTGVRFDRLPPR